MIDEILKHAGILAGAFVVYLAPKIEAHIKNRKKRSSFAHNLEIGAEIQSELDKLCASLKASRVALIDYHNGTSTYNGVPFDYATMSSESTDISTRRISKEYDHLPVSTMIPLLMRLNKSESGYVVSGYNDENKQISINNISYGIKKQYDFKLGPNLIDGCLSISWIDEVIPLTPTEILFTMASAQRLAQLRRKIKKH